jgi:hypothetical protein
MQSNSAVTKGVGDGRLRTSGVRGECARRTPQRYTRYPCPRLNYAGDRNDAKNLAIILLLTKFDYGTASAVGLAEVQISSLIGREV